jgi:CrcB protein
VAAVIAGGFFGSAGRTGIGYWLPSTTGEFPFATLATNLIGSFLLGFYLARRERGVSVRWSLQFWGIGVLGSFTTFSAFSLDVVHLVQDRQVLTALVYVLASLVAGLGLALVGERAGRVIR